MKNLLWMFMAVLLAALPASARTTQVVWLGSQTEASPETAVIAGEAAEVASGPGSAFLGVDIEDVTADRVAALKLKEERGVEIKVVDQDAPAGKAGLKVGDVILEFNGQRVESSLTLRRMIRETPPGRAVKLGISRDGQPLTVTATLADRNKMWAKDKSKIKIKSAPRIAIAPHPLIEMPSFDVLVRTTSSRNGLQVENLTHQLGEFFGVKNGEGVLVRSVEKNSPAEAAGIRAGDVIVKVEGERIADTGDWRRAMRRHKSGKVSLGVVREKREQSLSITIPEETREAQKNKDQSLLQFDWPEFEVPLPEMDFDFDYDFDSDELRQRLRKVQPELERRKQDALKQSKAELDRSRADVQRALRQAQAEMEREMQRLRRELDRELRNNSQPKTQ